MSRTCECCGAELNIMNDFYKTVDKGATRFDLCENCAIKYDELTSCRDKESLKNAIAWGQAICESPTSTNNAKRIIYSLCDNANKYINSLIKCDICGKDVLKLHSHFNNNKQCQYILCPNCNIRINTLKFRTNRSLVEYEIKWAQQVLSDGKIADEKKDNFTELLNEAQNFVKSTPVTTTSAEQKPNSFTDWSIALSPLLLIIMEFFGGIFIGGLVGFTISDGIFGAIIGALTGAWLAPSIGSISRAITRIENKISKDITELKNENATLTQKIDKLLEEKELNNN